ncbi:MAG: cytochrome c [Cyanobacteria bacterium]|nr:cytochrome c [Cyanobacteriota bacterium]
MKILLKILGGIIVLLLFCVACGYGYLMFAYPAVPPPTAFEIEATPERLARGKYLNDHVVGCTTCHTRRDWTKFSGPVMEDRLGSGGESFNLGPAGMLYSKNITPAAIGSWSDGDLLRAVTQGVSKDGTAMFPLMPYPHFGAMDQEDVHAVLAYIRSLKAIENTPPAGKLSFPLNLIVRTIPKSNTFGKRPPRADKVAYGQYMTKAALCGDCHTASVSGTPMPGMEFAGSVEGADNWQFVETGYRVRAANITPDANTGIGSWTEMQFIDKFKGFETATNTTLAEYERANNTVMPITAYAGMTRDDLAAIYAYLRTLKPVTNRVEKFPDAK